MNYSEKSNSCKECVHYEACKRAIKLHTELMDNKYRFGMDETKPCELFKPKSRFVELPCEVGKTIYRVGKGKVWEWDISVVEVYQDEILVIDDSDNYIKPEEIGKTVFLTREEAEKVLKERKKE